MRNLVVVLMLVTMSFSGLFADMEQGDKALESMNFKQAYNEYIPEALSGNSIAIGKMLIACGRMFNCDINSTTKNELYKKIAPEIKKLADNGNLDAEFIQLKISSLDSNSSEADNKKLDEALASLASRGHRFSKLYVFTSSYNDSNFSKQYCSEVEKLANDGFDIAKFFQVTCILNEMLQIRPLGELSDIKPGHPQYKEPIEKMTKIEELSVQALKEDLLPQYALTILQDILAGMYLNVDYFKDKKSKGVELLEKVAKNGDGSGHTNVGWMYYLGAKGAKKDFSKALSYFIDGKQDHNAGHFRSMVNLAQMYRYGEGTPINHKEAMSLFEEAAKYADDFEEAKFYAQANLGLMNIEGQGVEKNAQKAKEYFELSHKKLEEFAKRDSGSEDAQYLLSQMYLNGYYVKKDTKKAVQLLKKSADGNFTQSKYALAMMYAKGIGVKKDKKKAVNYLIEVIADGNKNAVTDLKRLL